ncbi:retrovirus-related pol polyprotein from transposon TNT 1-94 [Tanacetum coccineum]
MALILMANTFKLNNTTPTNNNQRSSSNPHSMQIAQPVQNVGNQLGHNAVQNSNIQKIANHSGNGNVVAAHAKGNDNGNNENKIRCYNCQGVDHYAWNCTVKLRKRDIAHLQTQLQIAQKEEAGIQLNYEEFDFMAAAGAYEEIERANTNYNLENNLQQASTSNTQSDKALVYDSDGSAELRAQLFDKESEQKDTTQGTSANTKLTKQSILGKPPSSSKPKLYSVTPFLNSKVIPKVGEMNALIKPVTLNSAPSTRESKVVNNDRVIAPGMFRINPFKTYMEEKSMPNNTAKASVRTKPITVSQPSVIHKQNVNSNSNGLSSTGVDNTVKTRRPQPRSNTKNDKVPFASKSSCIKNK